MGRVVRINTQKEYIVIGMGRFGSSMARQLEANGCKVLAIDRNEKRVNQIAEYVTLAMCVDVTNEDALRELGGRNFDGAVISIGHSLDASVLAAIWAKEQGIGQIIAFNNLFNAIELTSEYSITDVSALNGWAGKNLKELKLREKYGVNVIAIKRNGVLLINPPADDPTQKGDIFVI